MIYENSPEKIQAKNIGTLPFIYDENKSKLFYLRSTKELVSDSAKYNHYYDYYRNSQNIDKFSNQENKNKFSRKNTNRIKIQKAQFKIRIQKSKFYK